ncbi:MAG: cytochrome c biogenesis protein CcsA [Bacteroidota bacterium]
MQNIISRLKSILFALLNTRAGGVYILLFAIAIGAATFIENDFGTSAAQKVVFQAWWFELLLFLFGASVIYNIFKFRMVQQKKWALLMFHASIIIILIGAGVTRYWGYEGMMHIREGSSSNQFLSREMYLNLQVETDEQVFDFDEHVLFASLGSNDFEQSYQLGNDILEVKVKDFILNPQPVLYESMDGRPILQMVIAGQNGREEYFLEMGQRKRIRNAIYNFRPEPMPGAFNIWYRNDSLLINSTRTLSQRIMATQELDTLIGGNTYYPLRMRSLYTDGQTQFVFSNFKAKGKAKIESSDPKDKNESVNAVVMDVSVNGESRELFLYGRKGARGKAQDVHIGDLHISASYGSKVIELPFALGLYDFQLERYPGTNSPASYASEVQLIDQRISYKEDYRIYMNHILDYEGYRFFQSSYDKDEKGTYLSVNHDFWGTIISYLGYALLTLGMLWTLVSKRTRFYQVGQQIDKIQGKKATLTIALLASICLGTLQASVPLEENIVSKEHAKRFSNIIVQDFKGRMKPVHTLSREVLRKIHRSESFNGINADQILLSLYANPRDWYAVPLIKLGKHKDIQKLLGVEGKYAAFKDFFTLDDRYKLQAEMARIESLAPIDRGVYEKEIIKIDERVNILNMAFSGHLLRLIPKPNDPNNSWEGPHRHRQNDGRNHQSVSDQFFGAYRAALNRGLDGKGFGDANALLEELSRYQQEQSGTIIPSPTKIKAEMLLNQSAVFNRLTGVYMLLGLGFLVFLFLSVFRPDLSLRTPYKILFGIAAAGFLLHTVGLGLRWYVSGRAPWSNGYESMIYIAWTTTLAGMIFTRKSLGGLAATMILAGTILFVATLSFLDPEITPLVPVLRSYWLTIHVSLEAGSYGFLMLGAIIGLINLILMAFLGEGNHERVKRIVKEMSLLSERTLTGGLFMVSIGTYLGGVWANESWGRYWGWDAKETWALVTILVYSFILHMRIIPRLFGQFSYNLASIFGLASVVMTYYGVNYYLSGLHSYATGDPVPIPSWVYMFVGAVTLISALAYYKSRKYPLGR